MIRDGDVELGNEGLEFGWAVGGSNIRAGVRVVDELSEWLFPLLAPLPMPFPLPLPFPLVVPLPFPLLLPFVAVVRVLSPVSIERSRTAG
jgi:hypothetical protein